jgi:tRNA (guanine37-N1)-methyltransferase
MRIDILTLFPNMFDGFLNESIIKRAREKGLVEINIINIRDFTPYKNGQVDDYAFGGGAGMVLMCEPVYNAINSVKDENSRIILTSPRGNKFNQSKAKELKSLSHLIIVCGHYEGFDERILNFVDEEISIGDYVLTGGEIPSMAITDAVTRLIDGVITKESLDNESFNDDLLDYPVYTKPREFMGMEVPEILLSGDHKKIDEYRQNERVRLTSKYKKTEVK